MDFLIAWREPRIHIKRTLHGWSQPHLGKRGFLCLEPEKKQPWKGAIKLCKIFIQAKKCPIRSV